MVCFSSKFVLEGKREDRLHCHNVLTASAATSLFFMNRGIVADSKLPVMGCRDTTDEAQSPRNTALALVTLDPTAKWILISHHQGPQCGQVTGNMAWCLRRWHEGEASRAGNWES